MKRLPSLAFGTSIGLCLLSGIPANAEFDSNKMSIWNQTQEEIKLQIDVGIKARTNAGRAGEQVLYCDFNVKILLDAKQLVAIHESKADYYQMHLMENMASREAGIRSRIIPLYNALIREQIICDQKFPNRWPFLKSYLSQ